MLTRPNPPVPDVRVDRRYTHEEMISMIRTQPSSKQPLEEADDLWARQQAPPPTTTPQSDWMTPQWLVGTQQTGYLDKLAALAAQNPDEHTVPAMEAIRLKHERREDNA
jgi:hypothetical protein